jgi:hypothetical protein
MSAEKLTVILPPAISRRDYLAKSVEKANARGADYQCWLGFVQATFLVNCNHARWMRVQSPVPFRSGKLRVVLGGVLLSDSRKAEFEECAIACCLRPFMRFLFPPDPISPLLLISGASRCDRSAPPRRPLQVGGFSEAGPGCLAPVCRTSTAMYSSTRPCTPSIDMRR